MDIGGIGEFSLIASIRRRMEGKYPPEVALGIGDDCAVLHPQVGMDWVITSSPTMLTTRSIWRGVGDHH